MFNTPIDGYGAVKKSGRRAKYCRGPKCYFGAERCKSGGSCKTRS